METENIDSLIAAGVSTLFTLESEIEALEEMRDAVLADLADLIDRKGVTV